MTWYQLGPDVKNKKEVIYFMYESILSCDHDFVCGFMMHITTVLILECMVAIVCNGSDFSVTLDNMMRNRVNININTQKSGSELMWNG